MASSEDSSDGYAEDAEVPKRRKRDPMFYKLYTHKDAAVDMPTRTLHRLKHSQVCHLFGIHQFQVKG